MNAKELKTEIEIPGDIQASTEKSILTLKGKVGELKRSFRNKKINISTKDNLITLLANNVTKREKRMMGSFTAHINNMLKGVNEKHLYQLKICSGHFPMNVSVSKEELTIKNFLGEKIPRKIVINEGVEVKIDGEIISVEGINKELVAGTTAKIEQLTRITNRDNRIFQDGCYIILKDGKELK